MFLLWHINVQKVGCWNCRCSYASFIFKFIWEAHVKFSVGFGPIDDNVVLFHGLKWCEMMVTAITIQLKHSQMFKDERQNKRIIIKKRKYKDTELVQDEWWKNWLLIIIKVSPIIITNTDEKTNSQFGQNDVETFTSGYWSNQNTRRNIYICSNIEFEFGRRFDIGDHHVLRLRIRCCPLENTLFDWPRCRHRDTKPRDTRCNL